MDSDPRISHPSFPQPPDAGGSVWRYMSFAKLVSLLTHRALWLTRVDLLGDTHEGANTAAEERQIARIEKAISAAGGRVVGYNDRMDKIQRQWTYVSCWCYMPHESNALWRVYCGRDDGVAVRTTYTKLVNEMPSDFLVGQVRYIDYTTATRPSNNGFEFTMHKRQHFEYESEVRCVCWGLATQRHWEQLGVTDNDELPSGLAVPVRLHELIEEIVVGPDAPSWFLSVLGAVLDSLDLKIPLRASQMAHSPRFPRAPISDIQQDFWIFVERDRTPEKGVDRQALKTLHDRLQEFQSRFSEALKRND